VLDVTGVPGSAGLALGALRRWLTTRRSSHHQAQGVALSGSIAADVPAWLGRRAGRMSASLLRPRSARSCCSKRPRRSSPC